MSDTDPLAELIEVVRARIERQEERLAEAEAALADQKRAAIEALLNDRKETLATPAQAPGGSRVARLRSKVLGRTRKQPVIASESPGAPRDDAEAVAPDAGAAADAPQATTDAPP